jgi:hypothetical protein
MVFHIKGRKQAEELRQRGAEEDSWNYKGRSEGRLKKKTA